MTSDGAAFVAAWDAAFNAAPEAAAELFAEDARYEDHRPLGWEPLHGRTAIREWFRTLSTGGATIRARSRVLEETPARIAIAQVFQIVAGEADGGGDGEVTVWVVLRLAGGLIAELRIFGDQEAALAAFRAA